MADDKNISENTRRTLQDNNIPEEEMTGSELRQLDSEVNGEMTGE